MGLDPTLCPNNSPADLAATGTAALPQRPADVRVPAVLDAGCFQEHLHELTNIFQPVGHLEATIVRDLARHAAAMDLWAECLQALLVERARQIPALLGAMLDEADPSENRALAGAIAAPNVHLCEQHAQRRSQAFYRALRTLQELQAQRKSGLQEAHPTTPDPRFTSDEECTQYLAERFETGARRCPQCNGSRGYFLATRCSWECATCGHQAGLRVGTVMADSQLGLAVWFQAIELVLLQPAISAVQLAEKLGVRRVATARKMAAKIRAAMGANNASALLAGLDHQYARGAPTRPASGAQGQKKTHGGRVAAPALVVGDANNQAADGYVDAEGPSGPGTAA